MMDEFPNARTDSADRDNAETSEDTGPVVHKAILLLIPVALAILAYAGTLQYPFIFDDIPNIVDNPAIRVTRLDAPGLLRATFNSPSATRPVANISFALNYWAHGYAVAGYHCVNILVHVVTAMIFYLLAAETLKLTRRADAEDRRDSARPLGVTRDGTDLVALAAATLWMIHPLQTQSVTYIVQRMNSLAAMFYLLSILLYVRSRIASVAWKKAAGFSVAALSGLLAVGSKEIAVTLPFFLILYEWFFFQDLDPRWLRRQWPWVAFLVTAAAGVVFFYLGENPLGRIIGDYGHRDFTPTERLLTQPRVVLFYLSLLAFPHPARLNLDHDLEVSRSLLAPPSTLAAIVAVAGILLLALVSARRHRLLSFALLWFLGNLVIESSIIGLEMAFEHRTYLPSMFLFLALTAWAAHSRFGRRTKAVALGALVLCLGLWAYERNSVWQDDLTLWQDCADKSPQKPRPKNNLGVALARTGQYEAALENFSRVGPENRADFGTAQKYIGLVLIQLRQPEAALAHFEAALALAPDNPDILYSMGNALYTTGRIEEAIGRFRTALKYAPDNAMIQNNLGIALMADENPKAAVDHFKSALLQEPENADFRRNLEIATLKAGAQ